MPIFECIQCGDRVDSDRASADELARCSRCGAGRRFVPSDVPANDTDVFDDFGDPEPPPLPATTPRTPWWVVLCVLLSAGLFVGYSLYVDRPISVNHERPDEALSAAYLTGEVIGVWFVASLPALIIAAIARAAGRRFRSVFEKVFAGVVVAVTVMVITGDWRTSRLARENEDYTAIRNDVMAAISGHPPAASDLPDKPFDELTGPELVRVLLYRMAKNVTENRARLDNELASVDFDRLLDAKRITKDRGLVESFRMLDHGKKAYQAYWDSFRHMMKDVTKGLEDPRINPSFRQGVVGGLQNALAKDNSTFNEMVGIEKRWFACVHSMLLLLKATENAWTIDDDGNVIFDRTDDSDSYTVLFNQLSAIEAERETFLQHVAAREAAARERLQHLPD